MRKVNLVVIAGLFLGVLAAADWAVAEQAGLSKFETVIFSTFTRDIGDFESFVKQAKEHGATHIDVATNLPLAYWHFDTPGDPYPAWMLRRAGILEICPPPAIREHIPADFSSAVLTTLKQRCQVLRKHNLKGFFFSKEPQILPEKIFEEHPLWRGPRVDQPNRSRVARFAPCVDNAEVLQLYRTAMAELIRQCPEIKILDFLTTDAGSGLCWSRGLYPGRNGNSLCKDRRMDERVLGFLHALREGAKQGGGDIELHMLPISPREWMIPSLDDSKAIARQLERGMAVDNMEGPDATPFAVGAGVNWEWNFFYPVVGVFQPMTIVQQLCKAQQSGAARLRVIFEPYALAEHLRVFEWFWADPPTDEISQLQLLKTLAAEEVGPDNAAKLLSMWLAIEKAVQYSEVCDIGPAFVSGGIHQRWITRPLVPFSERLTADEKEYFWKFLFQARTEEHARNMIDLQATQVYGGWSGRFFVNNLMDRTERPLKRARSLLAEFTPSLSGQTKQRYELLDKRLQAAICLVNNVRNVVSYQAQVDRVRQLGLKAEYHAVLGTQSSWDRQLMLETARKEIDNTAVLINLLESTSQPIFDLASTKKEETIRILGPDIIEQLRKKIKIMNAHWLDYNEIFAPPNP